MKVDITYLAVEIAFQMFDHVVAMDNVAEQCISTQYSKCYTDLAIEIDFQVTSACCTEKSS